MLSLDYKTYLCDDILQKVDRATMHVSLEGREPFLDHHLAEWVACLPQNFKYHKGQSKRLLKDINQRYLPPALMNQPKKGFAVPLARWLQNELKDELLNCFDENFINAQGIFNQYSLNQMLNDFYKKNKLEIQYKIWYLYMFQKWYKLWHR